MGNTKKQTKKPPEKRMRKFRTQCGMTLSIGIPSNTFYLFAFDKGVAVAECDLLQA